MIDKEGAAHRFADLMLNQLPLQRLTHEKYNEVHAWVLRQSAEALAAAAPPVVPAPPTLEAIAQTLWDTEEARTETRSAGSCMPAPWEVATELERDAYFDNPESGRPGAMPELRRRR